MTGLGKIFLKNDVKYCSYKVNEEKSLKQQQKNWGRKKSENENDFFSQKCKSVHKLSVSILRLVRLTKFTK